MTNKHAQALGRLGARARLASQSPEKRREVAALGGAASWAGIPKEERSRIMRERAKKRTKCLSRHPSSKWIGGDNRYCLRLLGHTGAHRSEIWEWEGEKA